MVGKLYKRGSNGYPVGADEIMRKAYGKIPKANQEFQGKQGWAYPKKVYGWGWNHEHRRWIAMVEFHDGWKGWAYPRSKN